jgi:hypothetical protein
MKKMNIKLKLSAEQKNNYSKWLLENRRLVFILFLGIVVIYTFNIVYNKAFVEVSFIEYPVVDNAGSTYKEKTALDEIMQSLKEKQANEEKGRSDSGKDPFNFAPGATTTSGAATLPVNAAGADNQEEGGALMPRHAD